MAGKRKPEALQLKGMTDKTGKVIPIGILVGLLFVIALTIYYLLSPKCDLEVQETILPDAVVELHSLVDFDFNPAWCRAYGPGEVRWFRSDGRISMMPLKEGTWNVCLFVSEGSHTLHVYSGRIQCGSVLPVPPDPEVTEFSSRVTEKARELPSVCIQHGAKALAAVYREAAVYGSSLEDKVQFIQSRSREALGFNKDPGYGPEYESGWYDFLKNGGTMDSLIKSEYPEGVGDGSALFLSIAKGLEAV